MIRIVLIEPIAEPGHQEIPATEAFLPALPPLVIQMWRVGQKGWRGEVVIGVYPQVCLPDLPREGPGSAGLMAVLSGRQ